MEHPGLVLFVCISGCSLFLGFSLLGSPPPPLSLSLSLKVTIINILCCNVKRTTSIFIVYNGMGIFLRY